MVSCHWKLDRTSKCPQVACSQKGCPILSNTFCQLRSGVNIFQLTSNYYYHVDILMLFDCVPSLCTVSLFSFNVQSVLWKRSSKFSSSRTNRRRLLTVSEVRPGVFHTEPSPTKHQLYFGLHFTFLLHLLISCSLLLIMLCFLYITLVCFSLFKPQTFGLGIKGRNL